MNRTDLPAVGGNGGGNFDETCGELEGQGDSSVIVGLSAEVANDTISRLRALCAPITLREDGGIRWTAPQLTSPRGSNGGAPETRSCNDAEIVTGFVGYADGLVSGIEVRCQAIRHVDGALRFEGSRTLPILGTRDRPAQPPASCGPLEATHAIAGKSGSVIDRFTLRCVPTEQAICGDGVVVEPETCDDGNVTPGDGCDATCGTYP